jgi:hypothetical protein
MKGFHGKIGVQNYSEPLFTDKVFNILSGFLRIWLQSFKGADMI